MLITFGGLPATGKTTLARKLAERLSATYLRIDSIEQALVAGGVCIEKMGPRGYLAAYAVAADNLRLGNTVIADAVNPIAITRNAWKKVAQNAGVKLFEIEIICSDKNEHRSRAESRIADIPGHPLPDWDAVVNKEYERWDSADIVIDSATLSAEQAAEMILMALSK